jgi:hypothetical protein
MALSLSARIAYGVLLHFGRPLFDVMEPGDPSVVDTLLIRCRAWLMHWSSTAMWWRCCAG